jgi:MFS family permease
MAVATALVGIVIFAVVKEPSSPVAAHRETWSESLKGIRAAARIPSVGRLFLMQMVIHSSFMIAVGLWGGPYLSHVYGCDLTERGLLLLVPALTQIVGLFAFGLTDRVFGAYKPGVLIGSVSMIACFAVIAGFGVLPRAALVAWFAVFGLVSGYMPALVAHGKSLLPLGLVGRGMTLLNMGTMGGAFLVQVVSGFVIDLFPALGGVYPLAAYRTVFVLHALFVAAAVVVYLPARDPRRQPSSSAAG